MRTILISGCAGFIGQNLAKSLLNDYRIIGIDNFYSSNKNTIQPLLKHENFKFINSDIIELIEIEEKIDIIYNLACPASPPIYQKDPLFTLDTNYVGTKNLLNIAKKHSSIFIQASTSEVYGDPEIHPLTEEYNVIVNTMGVRSCYDEGKRIAETLCYEYKKLFNVKTRIVRIFNTYGPGMEKNDGRIISNFMVNSIKRIPLEIYGSGKQTRSFCYISDLIEGLIRCMEIEFHNPINLGNNSEISLNELAEIFRTKYGANEITYSEAHDDDPKIRKPNIKRAKTILNWEPTTNIFKVLDITYEYFKEIVK